MRGLLLAPLMIILVHLTLWLTGTAHSYKTQNIASTKLPQFQNKVNPSAVYLSRFLQLKFYLHKAYLILKYTSSFPGKLSSFSQIRWSLTMSISCLTFIFFKTFLIWIPFTLITDDIIVWFLFSIRIVFPHLKLISLSWNQTENKLKAQIVKIFDRFEI